MTERLPFRGSGILLLLAVLATGAACNRVERQAGPARDTLKVLSSYLPEEIDPYADSRFISRILAVNVFDPLVRAGSTGEPVPALAASWSNPSPDVWRFQLRDGARFSDGSPVTSADVVQSFERARAEGSAVAGSLASVKSVQADGPQAVDITAAEGSGVLLPTLTAVLIAREAPAAPAGRRNLGTGPYEVVQFVPGTRVELKATASSPAEIRHTVWECFSSGPEAIESLKANPGTLVIDPPEEAARWAAGDKRFTLSSEFSGALQYLGFGLRKGPDGRPSPFSEKRAREAVRLALDIPALLEVVGPAAGFPASQLVPSGVFGFDPEIRLRQRDLSAARSLISSLGLGERKVSLDTTQPNAHVARAVAAQLREAGLDAEVRVQPSPAFRRKIETESQLFLFSWVVGPDAGEPLRNFFHTKDVEKGLGLNNRTGFSNPDFDRAIQEAARVSEPSARLPLLKRAIQILDREIPWVPLYTIRSVRLHPRDLGISFRSDGMLLLSDLSRNTKRP